MRTPSFPPYELLQVDAEPAFARQMNRVVDKTRQLAKLYHQTQAQAWNPNEVLDELCARHGGIHLAEEKKEPLGHLFAILLWGELAAWNVAADLARWIPDLEARMAATGQAFDEARHFTVLREYLRRAEVRLPPLNPYGRRLLSRLMDTPSLLQKLYGMQLLVETLALAIFKRLAATKVEPVLTDLLAYIERDESRHVALGVIYLPELVAKASVWERTRNWAFNMEMFLLTIGGGWLLDEHFTRLGLDHKELGRTAFRLHRRVLADMAEKQGIKPAQLKGLYGLTQKQHEALNRFLHPDADSELSPRTRRARAAVDRVVRTTARWMA